MADVYFAGPVGRIEGKYHQSDNKSAPVVLILHPHSLFGGTMNNKVVYALYETFVKTGFTTLRMNFRGVGKSEGKFDNGFGELSDAAAAIDWLQAQNSEASHFWIAGFSFGTWVGTHLLMRRPEIEAFICISPLISKYDFSFLIPCPASGMFVQGDKDELVKANDLEDMIVSLKRQNNAIVEYHVVPGANHIFTDKIDIMQNLCEEYINTRLATRVVKPVRKKRRRRKKKVQEEE